MSGASKLNCSRDDTLGIAVVCAVAAAVLLTGLDWGTSVGIETVGGDRILRGQVPYRDFWTIYAPGSFYLVAALFAGFGRELSVIHAASALLAGASGLAFYALLRRAGLRAATSTIASVAFLVALWTPAPGLQTYVVPRLALLIGWERVLHAVVETKRRSLMAAGVAFGVAAWFKHDVAAYAALGSVIAVLAIRVRQAPSREVLRDALAIGLPAVAVVLPALGFVAFVGGADAWRDLIVFPLGDFRVVRGEPYPSFVPDIGAVISALGEPENPLRLRRVLSRFSAWAQAWLPALGLVTAAASLAYARLRDSWSARQSGGVAARAAIVLALACAPFYWVAAHVQQNTHVFSLGMLAALALAGAGRLLSRRGATLVAAIALALAVGFAMRPLERFALMRHELASGRPREFAVAGATNVRTSEANYASLWPVVDFIRANVPPPEAIYVGLPRHDAILIGEASLYFLAGRAPATRYHELHPGISETEEVQREMSRDIDAAGVRCVVRWNSGIADKKLDALLDRRRRELPDRGLGATWLDDQLAANFEHVRSFGAYDVYWRRGTGRPWERAR